MTSYTIPPLINTKDDEFFSIGDLARELEISTRTIRYYEECGLISPWRSHGNQRRYSRKERGRLKLILRAKEAFTLEEIKELFTIYDLSPDETGEQRQFIRMREMMVQKINQINRQIEQLTNLRHELNHTLEEISKQIWIGG